MRKLIECFLLLFFFYNNAFASGVSKCFSCSSPSCNDPFNSSNADIMNCSNITSYRSLTFDSNNEWSTENDYVFRKFNTLYSTDIEYVCVKYFVNNTFSTNGNFTMRRCMPKMMNNVSACDLVYQTVGPIVGQVKLCTTCDTDLCNSATRWSFAVMVTMFLSLFGYVLH